MGDDRVEEAFGFSRACAGANESGFFVMDGADGFFLMAVDVENVWRDQVHQMRVKDLFIDELGDFRPFEEGFREGEVGALE